MRSSGVGGVKHLPQRWHGPMKTSRRMNMSSGAFVAVSNCWESVMAYYVQTSSQRPQ